MKKENRPAESIAQQLAEQSIRAELEKEVGFILRKERFLLGDGRELEVDAANKDKLFFAEICTRLGKLQPAHLEKVASDILKLLFIERTLDVQCNKALCFANATWKTYFQGRSWIAAAAASYDVRIVVVGLPEEILLQIFAGTRSPIRCPDIAIALSTR